MIICLSSEHMLECKLPEGKICDLFTTAPVLITGSDAKEMLSTYFVP